jgi:cytochrome oxidase assembly protein ShyY1
MTWQDVNLVAAIGGIMTAAYGIWIVRNQQKTIKAQQDTIQKLLNREPVTYKEVGKPEPKEEEVRYSAWGSRMLTKDDYNKEEL